MVEMVIQQGHDEHDIDVIDHDLVRNHGNETKYHHHLHQLRTVWQMSAKNNKTQGTNGNSVLAFCQHYVNCIIIQVHY